jgi:predicted nuclease with RNAse H fold
MFVGIDVGANCLHCVALDDSGHVADVWLIDASELSGLISAVCNATAIAVDAPAQLSTAPHLLDPVLNRKFLPARCAEIALGRDYKTWVPWVTPQDRPASGWIDTGLRVFEALRTSNVPTIEVYPHAGYRVLARGRQLPKKSTAAGVRVRVDLLRSAGVLAEALPMWSHDGLDALLGAVVARDYSRGASVGVSCGHDDSAIWLPATGAL